MSLACFLARRRFVPYLDGEVRPGKAARLERHLGGCAPCSELFSSVKAGHEAGRAFGRLAPVPPARFPAFEEIRGFDRRPRARLAAFAAPALVAAAAGLVVFFAVTGRHQAGSGGSAIGPAEITPSGAFMRLAIRDFGADSRRQVVTEGYVQEVYYDEQERTLHIKLGESAGEAGPFVICEVRDAGRLTIPETGSRVRVYGRSRFDAQPGRGWHEVNPVMEIAVLNR
jgi:hypothetical protein